jgi:hypothetical protein
LRDTVYSDPGNPFDHDVEPDRTVVLPVTTLPEHLTGEQDIQSISSTPPPPSAFWRKSWSYRSISACSRRKALLEIDTRERRSHEDGKKFRRFEHGDTASPSSSSASSSDDYRDFDPPTAFWRGGTGGLEVNKLRAERYAPAMTEKIHAAFGDDEGKNERQVGKSGCYIHAPTPRRSGTPVLIRELSVPAFVNDDETGRYKERKKEGNEVESRDTKFYKFYSGVLGEYVKQ